MRSTINPQFSEAVGTDLATVAQEAEQLYTNQEVGGLTPGLTSQHAGLASYFCTPVKLQQHLDQNVRTVGSFAYAATSVNQTTPTQSSWSESAHFWNAKLLINKYCDFNFNSYCLFSLTPSRGFELHCVRNPPNQTDSFLYKSAVFSMNKTSVCFLCLLIPVEGGTGAYSSIRELRGKGSLQIKG